MLVYRLYILARQVVFSPAHRLSKYCCPYLPERILFFFFFFVSSFSSATIVAASDAYLSPFDALLRTIVLGDFVCDFIHRFLSIPLLVQTFQVFVKKIKIVFIFFKVLLD